MPKPSIILTEAAKEKAQKAKAYIESKYRKLDNEERERKEGMLLNCSNHMFLAWDKLTEKMQMLNLSESE